MCGRLQVTLGRIARKVFPGVFPQGKFRAIPQQDAPMKPASRNPFDLVKFTLEKNGTTVHGEVSPCSFMYPTYGLQIRLALSEKACNAESIFAIDKTLEVSEMDDGALRTACLALAEAKLAGSGIAELEAQVAKWKQARAQFEAEDAKRQSAQAKRDAREDAKMKAQGFTHKVVGWVHPLSGDDYMVEGYVRGVPTPADLRKILRGSEDQKDYKVTEL